MTVEQANTLIDQSADTVRLLFIVSVVVTGVLIASVLAFWKGWRR